MFTTTMHDALMMPAGVEGSYVPDVDQESQDLYLDFSRLGGQQEHRSGGRGYGATTKHTVAHFEVVERESRRYTATDSRDRIGRQHESPSTAVQAVCGVPKAAVAAEIQMQALRCSLLIIFFPFNKPVIDYRRI
jgi:hypothetical protein